MSPLRRAEFETPSAEAIFSSLGKAGKRGAWRAPSRFTKLVDLHYFGEAGIKVRREGISRFLKTTYELQPQF